MPSPLHVFETPRGPMCGTCVETEFKVSIRSTSGPIGYDVSLDDVYPPVLCRFSGALCTRCQFVMPADGDPGGRVLPAGYFDREAWREGYFFFDGAVDGTEFLGYWDGKTGVHWARPVFLPVEAARLEAYVQERSPGDVPHEAVLALTPEGPRWGRQYGCCFTSGARTAVFEGGTWRRIPVVREDDIWQEVET